MPDLPRFPQFKPIELADREIIQPRLWDFQPQTSELTFTNLFIWRAHYGLSWSLMDEWLLFVGQRNGGGELSEELSLREGARGRGPLPPPSKNISQSSRGLFALPPVGPAPRAEISRELGHWLKSETDAPPIIERADSQLAAELTGRPGVTQEPLVDQFDYVYRVADLIHLAGRHYHDKRNHLNSFRRSHRFTYEPLEERHLADCLKLAANWCQFKRCTEDLNLMGEWEAVREALRHFRELKLTGGVVRLNGRVEAFTLGELLNRETAVVHIEKANPEIRGLYPMINQQFCEHAWSGTAFINREQDLGEPGLRAAKQSYHPHHLVQKFRISFR